jgi:hypothetical protein
VNCFKDKSITDKKPKIAISGAGEEAGNQAKAFINKIQKVMNKEMRERIID